MKLIKTTNHVRYQVHPNVAMKTGRFGFTSIQVFTEITPPWIFIY